jgi:recombination associated protein RdgC
MFKNLSLFKLAPSWAEFFMRFETSVSAGLGAGVFTPCGPTEQKSIGWVPPRGEAHGALLEAVAGQRIMKLRIETKSVPASVVRKRAEAEAEKIEAATGRKPGKKEMAAIKEDALLALLPQAFPKSVDILVWADPVTGILAIDSASTGKVDDTITALVNAFDGLSLSVLQTIAHPQTAMTYWLAPDNPDCNCPENFSIERACELRSEDEEKSVVKFNRHNLETDQVREHIAQGKLPKWTAMSYAGRVGFVLTENMQLKKIEFLDGVMAGRDANEADDGFDADVALATGELKAMIPALIEALGGELQTAKEST